MRRRRRVIPSRWDEYRAREDGELSNLHTGQVSEPVRAWARGRSAEGCSRTLPLYEAEEAARSR